MSNSSNPVREVRSKSLVCALCDISLEPSQVVKLPDLEGGIDLCCSDCAASERFFDTLERESISFFVQLLADVPEVLKASILEALGYAVVGAQMLCIADTKPRRQPRRVPFTAALESGSSFGAKLRALGMMPNPCALVAADGVFLEVADSCLNESDLLVQLEIEKLEQRAEKQIEQRFEDSLEQRAERRLKRVAAGGDRA